MAPPKAYGPGDDHWKNEEDVVMVVDDEPPMRRIIAMCLSRGGYKVLEATSAHDAVDILHTHLPPVRLLLTDLWMPDMDGLSLIREARQTAPELPILAMTGMASHRSLDDILLSFGVAALLLKPFSPKHLLESVHAAIEEQEHHPHDPH